jgi:hypothetical protein
VENDFKFYDVYIYKPPTDQPFVGSSDLTSPSLSGRTKGEVLIPYLRFNSSEGSNFKEAFTIEFSVFKPMSASDFDTESLLKEGFASQPVTTLFRHAEMKARSLKGSQKNN